MEEGGGEFGGQGSDTIDKNPVDNNPENKKFKAGLRLNIELQIGNIDNIPVAGRENLKDIPDGVRPVMAVSHISDLDLQIAAYSLFEMNPLITALSGNFQQPAKFLLDYIGPDNFASLRWATVEGKKGMSPVFDPTDFERIAELASKDKTPFVAAHNPTPGQLPEKGGLAAVYTASKLGTGIVLPVAVWINDIPGQPAAIYGHWRDGAKYLLKRPSANVSIGKPIKFEPVDITPIEEFYATRQSGTGLTEEQKRRFRETKEALQAQSQQVMEAIKAMMPKHKVAKQESEETNQNFTPISSPEMT